MNYAFQLFNETPSKIITQTIGGLYRVADIGNKIKYIYLFCPAQKIRLWPMVYHPEHT